MPTFTEHVPGTFCWPECATTDAPAARKFYSELLGWTWQDIPMGPDMTYSIAQKDGKSAAAMFQLDDAMKAAGVPPHWASYVSVTSVDATVAKAKELGGKLMMGPHDVPGQGRMAIVGDTIGAHVSLWEPRGSAGIQVAYEPGSLHWTQLNTGDVVKAKAFYPALLGWTVEDMNHPISGTYTIWKKSDGPAGGMMPMPPGTVAPSHWLVYWSVADTNAAHAKAEALGAKTFVPPTAIPGMLTFTVMSDPQGVMFALMTPSM